jgi:plasmid maintenance system antidote protein VapI
MVLAMETRSTDKDAILAALRTAAEAVPTHVGDLPLTSAARKSLAREHAARALGVDSAYLSTLIRRRQIKRTAAAILQHL